MFLDRVVVAAQTPGPDFSVGDEQLNVMNLKVCCKGERVRI